MKKKLISVLVLSGIIAFYGFLYIACSVDRKCDELCEKMMRVDSLMRNNYPQVYTYQCQTDTVCINVSDSTRTNWSGLADTACMYLNYEGLYNYKIKITAFPSGNIVVRQKCP